MTSHRDRQVDVIVVAVDTIPEDLREVSGDDAGVAVAVDKTTGQQHRLGPKYHNAKLFTGVQGVYLHVAGQASTWCECLTNLLNQDTYKKFVRRTVER
jgi:hypothetical protein